MTVLDARADGYVFARERVVKDADQVVPLVPDNSMRGGKNFKCPVLKPAGSHRSVCWRRGEPELRVEDAPLACGQSAALDGDPGQPVARDLKGDVTAGSTVREGIGSRRRSTQTNPP